jgi:hypothetical protein
LIVTFNDERALDRASGAKAPTLTKVAMSAITLNIFSVFVVKSDLLVVVARLQVSHVV